MKNIKAQIQQNGIKKLGGLEIIAAGKWFGELKKEHEDAGQIEQADFFNMLRCEMVYIITFLAKRGAETEIDNYTLPMHGITALGFDSTRIVEEVQEAIVLESTTKALGPAQRVDLLVNNPAIRAKQAAYESRKDAYVKDSKLQEFELLFSKKEFETVRLGTQGIREHIEYYIRNGKRNALIPYLMNSVFAHKSIDYEEAHDFINRFKEVYAIKEPNMGITLDVEKDADGNYKLPSDVWKKVIFSTEEKPTEYCEAYMMRRHGIKANLLFDTKMKSTLIHRIKKWRKATVEEVRTEVMQQLLFGSPAYKLTIDLYGNKFIALDKNKHLK